ncbi:MAG: hypothetical protein KKF48_04835 [Nanoarchaeota archaeon]|nr:hypothetical protein [Nanoarchaeota archaeon]MBU1028343.1 hypothetical protein [Nanoarchaeota archaeon]
MKSVAEVLTRSLPKLGATSAIGGSNSRDYKLYASTIYIIGNEQNGYHLAPKFPNISETYISCGRLIPIK